jgi:hypothetical protein
MKLLTKTCWESEKEKGIASSTRENLPGIRYRYLLDRGLFDRHQF